MTRSAFLVERPVFRLLLLAMMGLALASRLSLGATLPAAAAGDGAADLLAKLQAAMIMCHTGHGPRSAPALPRGPLLSDVLFLDQAENAHALGSDPTAALPAALNWLEVAFLPTYIGCQPPLWRAARPARGPPAAV